MPVSYTHLDVYKRQGRVCRRPLCLRICFATARHLRPGRGGDHSGAPSGDLRVQRSPFILWPAALRIGVRSWVLLRTVGNLT